MTEHNDPLWDPKLPAAPELAQMQRLLSRYRLAGPPPAAWLIEPPPQARRRRVWPWALAACLVLALTLPGLLWLRLQWEAAAPWSVQGPDGEAAGQLGVGETLQTTHSAKLLDVARIGQLQLAPGSRLVLTDTRRGRHRVSLAEGHLRARIWAPPGWFGVTDAHSELIDLGCEFDLWKHADGSGRVAVHSGWIVYRAGRDETLVPEHYTIGFRSDGIDTPLHVAATPALRNAVQAMDARFRLGQPADAALAQAVADAATDNDAYTLLVLLTREPALASGPLYSRLAEAFGLDGSNARHRAAWAGGNRHAIDAWWDALPRPPKQWWRYWRDALPW